MLFHVNFTVYTSAESQMLVCQEFNSPLWQNAFPDTRNIEK